MHRAPVRVLAILFLLCLAGCQSLEQFFQKPDVAFRSLSLKSMSLDNATAVFSFDVANPNPVGVTLRSLTYDLALDNKSIVRGTADKGLNIPARGAAVAELPVSVTYTDVIDSLADLAGKREIAYDLSGAFNFYGIAVPYHTAGTFPLPELPRISLKAVNITDLSLTGAAMEFILEIENANDFGFDFNGLTYDILLAGKSFVRGQSRKDLSVSPNATTRLPLPADINFLQFGTSAYKVLTGRSTGYEITGEMRLDVPGAGEKRVPFQKTGNVLLMR